MRRGGRVRRVFAKVVSSQSDPALEHGGEGRKIAGDDPAGEDDAQGHDHGGDDERGCQARERDMGHVLARRVIARDLPAFTSVLQGGIRFNTYIGLSLAGSLFGSEGSAVAAIIAAILVPTVNVISSLGFEFLRTGPSSLLALFKAIVTNPLVLGCVAGAAANVSGLGLPDVAATVLEPLAAASLPIGLLCVGAGLQAVTMRDHARAIIASTFIKLIVLPGLSLVALSLFAVPAVPALVGLLFQSIATASSGYVMARQLGGDSKLMAALIAGQTIVGISSVLLA